MTRPEPTERREQPFTPKTLAERWQCSRRHVTALCVAGRLRAFRLGGKLWRIPAEEVARWETGGSDDTEGASAPSETTTQESATVTRLERLIETQQRG